MHLTLHKTWHTQLQDEIAKPYIQDLKLFLSHEYSSGTAVYPPEELVFNAFSQTPFDKVKVVIVGQDPYHRPNQAHGLSFSVRQGVTPPPSLKNIYKELESDVGVIAPDHGCLEQWAKQGVLLLNATLTVRSREPRSHYGKGWELFTDAVIEKLRERKDPIVFLLWGKSAQEKCASVLDKAPHTHAVFTAAHPSPYSATKFFGCKHFSKANECLKKWGKTPIDWSL